MSMEQSQKYCKGCEREVLVQRPKRNHILHLLLTICTAGVWGIVWGFLIVFHKGGWHCSRCGRKL